MTAVAGTNSSPATTELAQSEFAALRRFPGLDGLRAVCIGTVILQHSANSVVARWSGGFNGVVLFFVISGFLITSLLLREESRFGSLSLRAFFTRRFFRILPLYYAVLALYIVLVTIFKLDARWAAFNAALPYYIGFFQEHIFISAHPAGVAYYPFEVSWSLGFEEKFYLVFPVLVLVLLQKFKSYRLPLVGALMAVCATAPLFFGHGGYYLFWYFPLLAGAGCALVLHVPSSYSRLAWLGRRGPLYLVVASALAGYQLTQLQQFGGPALRVALYVALVLVFGALIVGIVTSRPSAARRALEHRAVVVVGSVSYAMYLTHLLVLNVVERVVPSPDGIGALVAIPATFAATVGLCIPLQRYFEGPITDYGRRVATRRFGRGSQASPPIM